MAQLQLTKIKEAKGNYTEAEKDFIPRVGLEYLVFNGEMDNKGNCTNATDLNNISRIKIALGYAKSSRGNKFFSD